MKRNIFALLSASLLLASAHSAWAECPTSGDGTVNFDAIKFSVSDSPEPKKSSTTWVFDADAGDWHAASKNEKKQGATPSYNGADALDVRNLGLCLATDPESDETSMYLRVKLGAAPMSYKYSDGKSYQLGLGPLGEDAGLPQAFRGATVVSFVKADDLTKGAVVYELVVQFNLEEGDSIGSVIDFPTGYFLYKRTKKVVSENEFRAARFNPDGDEFLEDLSSSGDGGDDGGIDPDDGGDDDGFDDGDFGGDDGGGDDDFSDFAVAKARIAAEDPGSVGEDGSALPELRIVQDLASFGELTGITESTKLLVKVETYQGEFDPYSGDLSAKVHVTSGGFKLIDKSEDIAAGTLDSLKRKKAGGGQKGGNGKKGGRGGKH